MTDFSNLDRADRWLDVVVRAVEGRLHDAGSPAERRAARERASRLLVRAVNKRDRAAARLAASGYPLAGVMSAGLVARTRAPRPRARAFR